MDYANIGKALRSVLVVSINSAHVECIRPTLVTMLTLTARPC